MARSNSTSGRPRRDKGSAPTQPRHTGASGFETVVHRFDRRRFVRVVLALLGVAAIMLVVYLGQWPPLDWTAIATLKQFGETFAAFAFAGFAALVLFREESRPTTGCVRSDGVFVGQRCVHRFGDEQDASYERLTRGGLVHFIGRGGRRLCAVAVQSDDEALRVLTTAATAQRSRWWVPPAKHPPPAILAAIVMFLIQTSGPHRSAAPLVPFALLAVLTPLVVKLRRRRRVELESDHLSVGGFLRARRIPLRTLRSVVPLTDDTVRVEHDGGNVDIVTGAELGLAGGALGARRDIVVERMQGALAREQNRSRVRELASQLTRGERSVERYVADLAAMQGSGTYRSAPIRDEDLWAILEEPSVADDARAACALLLQRRSDPSATERIRVAVSEDESPRLRVAIERILETPEDDLKRAFAQLESPGKRAILR